MRWPAVRRACRTGQFPEERLRTGFIQTELVEEVVANVLGQAGFVGEIMFALPGLHVVNSFTRSDKY